MNLSQDFQRADREEVHKFRIAQVVYSLTELPDVDAVRFFIEGDPITVIDQNGNPTNRPVGRGSYSRFQPLNERTPVDPCTLVESLESCPQDRPLQ